MSYRALEYFKDLKDNGYEYHTGDTFPRVGYKPSESRLAELLSDKNKRGRAMIEQIKAKAKAPTEPEPAPAPKKAPAKKRAKKNAE